MNDFFEHLIHEFTLPLRNPVLIFSLILFIILLSPRARKRLNVPGIIGLIISGVVRVRMDLTFWKKHQLWSCFRP